MNHNTVLLRYYDCLFTQFISLAISSWQRNAANITGRILRFLNVSCHYNHGRKMRRLLEAFFGQNSAAAACLDCIVKQHYQLSFMQRNYIITRFYLKLSKSLHANQRNLQICAKFDIRVRALSLFNWTQNSNAKDYLLVL